MFKNQDSFLVAILISIVFIVPASAQVKKYPKSLLWKISGKGLQQPSYLYGTIHLTDKRVFNFSDSLYRAIESTNGLAIEIHPDSAINEFLYKKMDDDSSVLLKSILSKKEFSRLSTAISIRTMKSADKATVKDLVDSPDDYSKEMFRKGNMNTFMDAWLYATAKKQGKWTGGIEDVADQAIELYPEVKNAEDVERILNSKVIDKKQVDEFVKVYLLEDINRITEITGIELDEDTVLIRRNKKMAYRMDSLAAIRPTFFAVGAAHLPGTQGVIELLQRRGFELTPVISTSRLHASNYQYKEVEADWISVTSIDSLYTVEMPGMPDNKSQNLTNLSMKMYADITTGLAYLCGVRPSPGDPEKSDSLMTDIIKLVMAKGDFSKPISIQYLGMNGKEVTGKSDKNAYIRLQLFYQDKYVYFLVLSGTQIELLKNENAERFFHSIKPLQRKPPGSWALFNPSDGYVEVKMPEKVRKLTLPVQADLGKTQTLQVFSAVDNESGNTYLLRFGKTLFEYYLPNDSVYFHELQQNFLDNAPGAVVMDSAVTTFEGYPAYSVIIKVEEKYAMRFLFVNRGNRHYMLGMVSEWDKRYGDDAQSFFSSLKFMPMPNPALKKAQGWNGAFSTEAPGELVLKSHDSDTTKQEEDFTPYVFSYDSISAVSYSVVRDSTNKFMWWKSDSAYFKSLREIQHVNRKDSVGEARVVKNGSLPGIEMDVYNKSSKQIQRIRILFDEYAYYKISAFMPPQLATNPNYNRFFEAFRVTNETFPVTLYQNKGCALLKALTSTDSTDQKLAKAVLADVPFDSSNLTCLYEAMLKEYPVDTISGKNINDEIFDAISLISDSNVVKHIEKIYPGLPKNQVKFSNDLLNILAISKTAYAYQVLNRLLNTRLPSDKSNTFFNVLDDSLQLTRTLYPDILKHSADSNMVLGLSFLTGHLLDSALITIDQVKNYSTFWEAAAKKTFQDFRRENADFYMPYSNDLLNFLGKLNSVEANRILQQFAGLKNKFMSFAAIKVLLNNKQPIQPVHLINLCSDDGYRQFVYDTLKGANKLKLFPAKYLTQKYFAQSSIYETASDDYDVSLKLIGERQIQFNGKKKKFYLFKVTVIYDKEAGEKEEFLGISGPFSLNAANVEMEIDTSSVYFEEAYDAKQLERQLKLLIAQMRSDYEESN